MKKPLLDDFAPYIFRTHDFGKTWTKIVTGIGANDYMHVGARGSDAPRPALRRHQHGFYVSFDDGDHWQSLSLNLPDTQVSDIWVEANSTRDRDARPRLLHPRRRRRRCASAPAWRRRRDGVSCSSRPTRFAAAGRATIAYLLKKPAQKLTLEILDAQGRSCGRFEGAWAGRARRARRPRPRRRACGAAPARGGSGASGSRRRAGGCAGGGRTARRRAADEESGGGRGRGGPPTAPMAAGLNRVTWDLAYPAPVTFPGMVLWGATTNGPLGAAGHVSGAADGGRQGADAAAHRQKHPLRNASRDADLQEQFDLAIQIRDKVSEANNAVIQIRAIKQQVDGPRSAKSHGRGR